MKELFRIRVISGFPFIFSDALSLSSTPGQFAMIWLPDVGEFPMSLSLTYGKKSSIVVKAMGEG